MSPNEIDAALFLFINKSLRNGVLDAIMPFLTKNPAVVLLPFVLLSFLRDQKGTAAAVAVGIVALVFADGTGHALKDYFQRLRPCHTVPDVNLLVSCSRSFSMPSNHATNSFAFAVAFWYVIRSRIAWPVVAVAGLVAFSRVYVGVHYPSDVAAGSAIGAGVAYLAWHGYRWLNRLTDQRSYSQALYFAVAFLSILRILYIFTTPLDLSPDEAHYWEWSRRLDWSYYSKGPLIALIIFVGTSVFGATPFGIRFFAVLLFALASILLFRVAKEEYDGRTALAAALLMNVVPLYSVYGVLLTIDSPFIFFWILSLFLFNRAVSAEALPPGRQPASFYWIALGVSMGLGFLAKYTMVFFYLSGFLFLLFHRDSRRLLTAKGPYIAFGTSALFFLPVIGWNASHDWVTFHHTAGQAHVAEGLQISLSSFLEFFGSQAGAVTPVIFFMMLYAVWKMRKQRGGAFLFWFSFPVFAFFLLKSIQGKVQANWAVTAYATGFIAFSAQFMQDAGQASRRLRIILTAGIVLALLVTVFAHFPSILDLPAKMDPTARLVGWKELGKEASRIYREMERDGPLFVMSDRYQISSELAFYMEGNPVTYCVNLGRRMNQYDLWPGFGKLIGHNAIIVMKKDRPLPAALQDVFGTCEKEVLALDTDADRTVQFTAFKCYDFRGMERTEFEKF